MWQFLGIAGLIGILLGAEITHKIDTISYNKLNKEYSTFKANTETLARVAEAEKKLIETKQATNKKKIDEENKRLRADVGVANKRLQNLIASGSYLPKPTGAPGSIETATFDRAKFDQAVRDFVGETAKLVGKGTEAITDLDSAKRWAQD